MLIARQSIIVCESAYCVGAMSAVTNIERVTYDFDSSNNPSWRAQWSSMWPERTGRNRTEKKFKTAYFLSIQSTQLSSEVSGTRDPPPLRPLVKANPIHVRPLTNVHCVSNGCCLDRRDYDTYWTDKDTFDVA